MTTTAYPPSIGGVQSHIAELRARLKHYEADVLTLWTRNRTDWLLGTTLRLKAPEAGLPSGVTAIGWDAATRRRMLPWVASYYLDPRLTSRHIAAHMVPEVEKAVGPDHGLVHNHRIGREFLAQASMVVARKRRIPFVLTPHHHPKWRGYRYLGWLDVYRGADAVLVHTNAERDELQRLGVKPERIHVTWGAANPPMPADGARFRKSVGIADQPMVLFLGQLYQYKGVAELVSAVEKTRDEGGNAHLVFIGPSTPFSTEFFTRTKRSWLHLMGRVDDQAKWDAVEASSVVCLPSRHEALGRVYLEAWSKGKPVIGGRIPAVSDVITDGKTGLLVDPASSDELASALMRILGDPAFAKMLGSNGEAEVRSRFSWDAVVSRVEEAYAEVLDAAARTAAIQ